MVCDALSLLASGVNSNTSRVSRCDVLISGLYSSSHASRSPEPLMFQKQQQWAWLELGIFGGRFMPKVSHTARLHGDNDVS